MSNVQVVVSGLAWMGSGFCSIEAAIQDLLADAQKEILLTAYSIGQAEQIFELLESALIRGVEVRLVVNCIDEQHHSAQNRLKNLRGKYHHFYLYSFEACNEQSNLHAKVVVADRQYALVGSSNLSYSGMVVNHELALLVSGEVASQVAKAIDRLMVNEHCILVLSHYEMDG